jgi:glycerol-3-phosphate O-acyltransferase
MPATVTLPTWLAVLLLAIAGWSLMERLFVPSVRWVLRRKVNRVIDELNTRLRLEIKPFLLTKRQVLIDRLTFDPKVLEAVEAQARELSIPREVLLRRVAQYSRETVPSFNAWAYFRIGYWLSRRVARLLYRVRLGFSDDAGLAAVAPDATVVFLMNHRSNMDYVLVAYLAADRTALSYAVGEWARIWPLQTLVRSTGAYFVRRNSKDPLYRRVLERYIAMATAGGVTQAVYPEGGLSRDGRLRPPKLGLLDYMLRGFDPQGERDLVFIPVGINYDRTLEDRTLLLDAEPPSDRSDRSDRADRAKRKKPFAALATTLRFVLRNVGLMLRSRWHRFGYACVNFGSPLSMKKRLAEEGIDPRSLDREQRSRWLESLAGDLMERIGRVIPVLPVPLVATVFLRHSGQWLSELEVKAKAQQLLAELRAAGAHVYVPRQDLDYAIVAGLRMLTQRHIVEIRDGLYAPRAGEAAILAYYAHSIGHLL